jgi:hypothetical protein
VAELAQNLVRADMTSDPRRSFTVSIDSKARGVGGAFLHRVVAGIDLMGQQQIDFGAQIRVLRTRVIEKLSLSLGVEFERLCQHFLHLLPTFGCDVDYLPVLSVRRNHNFAESHSRFVVAGEMPNTSETSSIVSPPKKRNSTI